ncbi:leucine-rich repeat protein, partial [Klosneuvirus KNV1]
GKPTIIDLCDFKDIDREDIIKDVNKTALDDMAEELFSHFNKKKSGYYRKTDAIVLNCLRGIMKEIGHELVKVQRERSEEINGKSFRRSHMIYHIK